MQTPQLLRKAAAAIATTGLLGFAIGLAAPPDVRGQVAPEAVFQNRLADYVHMRDEFARLAELPLEPNDARTAAAQRARVGRALRVMRAEVPQGNIFGGSVATLVRRIVAEAVLDDEVRAWVEVRARAASGVDRARVNAAFPIGAEHDVHPALLRLLPALPRGVAYRVVHYDLLLWDDQADFVIDVLPAAFVAQTV